MIVDFYLLPIARESLLSHACNMIVQGYSQQGRYYVHTQDQSSAERLDDLLWSQEAASFVPHQLANEHATKQVPVVLGWQPELPELGSIPTLVVLSAEVPSFASKFRHIIDLTSQDDASLEQGRARYRHYKSSGWPINYHDCRKSEYVET